MGRPASRIPARKILWQSQSTRLNLKRSLAAVSSIALVVSGALIINGLMPFKVDAAEAKIRLMDPSSFGFEMVIAKDPEPISASKNPIFGVGERCVQDTEFKALLSQGEVLASTDLTTDLEGVKSSSFHEDLIKFESETDATRAINLVRDGFENSECAFRGEYVNSELTGLATAQEEFGSGGSASVTFKNDMNVKSEFLNLDFTFSGNNTYVQRGDYLLVIETGRTLPGADRTASQIKEATSRAIKKMFG